MTSRDPKNPRVILLGDHQRIESLLQRLVAAVRADDRELSQKLWARVESAVLAHLDVEEMFVFPALREGHAAEIDRLRREHDALRAEMGNIGLAFELHTARCEAIESFCATLREHGEREEALAYVQAERTLPVSVAKSIAQRIAAVLPKRSSRSRGASARAT